MLVQRSRMHAVCMTKLTLMSYNQMNASRVHFVTSPLSSHRNCGFNAVDGIAQYWPAECGRREYITCTEINTVPNRYLWINCILNWESSIRCRVRVASSLPTEITRRHCTARRRQHQFSTELICSHSLLQLIWRMLLIDYVQLRPSEMKSFSRWLMCSCSSISISVIGSLHGNLRVRNLLFFSNHIPIVSSEIAFNHVTFRFQLVSDILHNIWLVGRLANHFDTPNSD